MDSPSSGVRWGFQTSRTFSFISSVDFINSTHGSYAAEGDTTGITSNGGNSWSTMTVPGTFRAIDFTSELNGVLAPSSSPVRSTEDGGLHWDEADPSSVGFLNYVSIDPQGVGWAVGDSGRLWRTTDGGRQWVHGGESSPSTLRFLETTTEIDRSIWPIWSFGIKTITPARTYQLTETKME
jgi:photosystem II stability/assembly factor-like uncharacterized protein